MPLLTKKRRTEGVSDPVKLLIVDHEKVERLFEQIEESESPVQRLGLVAQLDAELTRHTTVEERVLYPFIRDNVPDGPEMIEEAEQEHAEAKEALARVATLDPAAPNFTAELKKLKKLVSHHVKEEENNVFPKMDESVDVQDLNGLRAELERARMEETPTPSLPADTARRTSRTSTRRTTAAAKPKPKAKQATQAKQAKRSTRRPAARGKSTSATSVWVQPHHTDDGRWQVRREGASRASRVFDTQREAASFGRQMAKRERVEFVLAGRDGKVRERDSYGHDSPRRKG